MKISALELAMGRTDPGGTKSQRCDEEMAFNSGVNSCHRGRSVSGVQVPDSVATVGSILDGSEGEVLVRRDGAPSSLVVKEPKDIATPQDVQSGKS